MSAAVPYATLPSSTTSSMSSDDLYVTFISESADSTSRRTRKRFTNAQLTMLEQLFHQNSHPSREQREMCARACNMEVKSVTIWFQNKRQTERRTTLASGRIPPPVMIHSRGSYQRMPSPSVASSTSSSSTTSLSGTKRPSLDRAASRSELRAPAPRTPQRRHNPNAPVWDHMPSSPVGPPVSPPAHEFIKFGQDKQSRTLEYACARQRLSYNGAARVPQLIDDQDETDVEPDEAVTPPSTWGEGDSRWALKNAKMKAGGNAFRATVTNKTNEPDDDTMKAALALCGLMRG